MTGGNPQTKSGHDAPRQDLPGSDVTNKHSHLPLTILHLAHHFPYASSLSSQFSPNKEQARKMTSRPGHGPPGPSRGAPPARASSRAASSTSAFSRARAAAPDHPLGSHLARRPPASTASSSDAQALRGPRAMASTARTTSQPFGPAASEADTETEGDTVDEEDDDASDSVSTNFDHMDVDIDPNVDWDHVSNPSVTSTRGAVTQDSQGRPPMGAARMASLAKAYALQDDELDEDLTRENYARCSFPLSLCPQCLTNNQ